MNPHRIYLIVGALMVFVVIGVMAGVYLNTASSLLEYPEKTINYISGPDNFLAAGGRSAVVADVSQERMSMSRGETASFTISLTHIARTEDFKTLNLVAAGNNGYLVPPSYANSSSLEERAELLEKGIMPRGLIDLSPYITYLPAQVTLDAGETERITATFTVPKTLPDEMVGKSITISPNIQIVEMQVASPDRRSDAVIFPDGVSIIVMG